jgi:mandelate racemase
MAFPKIISLKARAVNVPLEFPVHTAVGTVATAPLVLIDLLTDTGITGHAYLFAYTPIALKPLRAFVEELACVVEGQELAPYALEKMLQQRFRLLGHTGLVRMACAGVDMAAWDALAKVHSVPLAKLLGGTLNPVNAYDSHSMDGELLATTRAVRAAEEGYTAIKTKIGYPTLEADLAVIRSIRREVGDGFSILVDFNQSLDAPEAIRRGRALEDEGVAWIEEPILQHDYDGHALIRAKLRVPIQLGENWLGPEEMFKSLRAGASDLGMPDVMKIGGVTGWLRAASLAQQYGMPVSSHLFQEFSAHLLSVTPTAHYLERLDIAGPILEPTLSFRNGHAYIPDLPGAGIIWREEEINRYLV